MMVKNVETEIKMDDIDMIIEFKKRAIYKL